MKTKRNSPQNRLTSASEVVQVYEEIIAGDPPQAVAARHGISRQAVNLIIRGDTYKQLHPVFRQLAQAAGYAPRKRGASPITEAEVVEIYRQHLADRKSASAVAAATGRSYGFVRNLLTGRAWPEYYHHFKRLAAAAGIDPADPPPVRHTNSVLPDETIMEIYRAVAAGAPQTEVGRRFGLHQVRISQIVRGASYGHLHHHYRAMPKHSPARPSPARRFTARQIANIHKQHRAGMTIYRLARKYGTVGRTISGIVNGRTYAELHPDHIRKESK